jgi:hypothetical protein
MKYHCSFMRALVLSTIGLISSGYGYGATYYCATNGADQSSRNGSSSQPWFNINYAMTRMTTGDDLILKEGTYYFSATQTVSKGGNSGNRMIIQGESGKTVRFNGQNVPIPSNNPYTINGLVVTGQYVTVQNIEVTNYPGGSGIQMQNHYGTVDNCRVNNVGWTGIEVGKEISDWSQARNGMVIQYCSTWNCAITNNPSSSYYRGLREGRNGEAWSASISAVICNSPTIRNCWAGENWGEGIIITRCRGGNTLLRENTARDNYSVNIYIDSLSGDSGNYADVSANTANTNYVSSHYRNNVPALNFAVAAENYDGFLVGSNPVKYVYFAGNTASNGSWNYQVGWNNYNGKSISNLAFDTNTANGSPSYGNYYQASNTSLVYSITRRGNTGF